LTDPLERCNLAAAICRRHADRVTRVALLDQKPLAENCYTFGGLDFLSDKFASTLNECGIREGDAVAVILGASAAFAVAILGALKRGAACVPLSPSLDLTEIAEAIRDSGAKAMVAPFAERDTFAAIAERDSLTTIFLAGDSSAAIHYEGAGRSFWRDVFLASSDFTPATAGSAPAFIFYSWAADGALHRVTHSHAAILATLAQIHTQDEQAPAADDEPCGSDDWASPEVLLGLIFRTWWIGGAVRTEPKRR
jgi:acyl-coenzyme A synthetase/AMP-(fatty) acid ligase